MAGRNHAACAKNNESDSQDLERFDSEHFNLLEHRDSIAHLSSKPDLFASSDYIDKFDIQVHFDYTFVTIYSFSLAA